jgi:hypothetical protein
MLVVKFIIVLVHFLKKTCLSHLVVLVSNMIKLFQDFTFIIVSFDVELRVKEDKVIA